MLVYIILFLLDLLISWGTALSAAPARVWDPDSAGAHVVFLLADLQKLRSSRK